MISEATQHSELATAPISLNKDEETVGEQPLDKQNTQKTANAFTGDIHFPKSAAFSEGIK